MTLDDVRDHLALELPIGVRANVYLCNGVSVHGQCGGLELAPESCLVEIIDTGFICRGLKCRPEDALLTAMMQFNHWRSQQAAKKAS